MNPSAERGSATIALSVLAALTAALGLGVARTAAAATSRARAETAADAAALAAAGELAAGRSGAAARRTAEETAGANGARLIRCDCRAGRGAVQVVVAMSRLPSFSRGAMAVARAELHPECPG